MTPRNQDDAITRADQLDVRLREASLGQVVEWLTALALHYRRVMVDGQPPQREIADIVKEMFNGLPPAAVLRSPHELDERRRQSALVQRSLDNMPPTRIAAMVEEMAEAFRDLLQGNGDGKLRALSLSMAGDMVLARSSAARSAVERYRAGTLPMRAVEDPRALLASLRAASC